MVSQNNQLTKEFFAVVKKGKLNEIKSMIDQYCLDVTKLVDDNFRHTSLFYAAIIPDPIDAIKVIEFFVDKGVPPVYTDILNQTVLYYTAREGKLDCCRFLIDKGCNVTHKDNYG